MKQNLLLVTILTAGILSACNSSSSTSSSANNTTTTDKVKVKARLVSSVSGYLPIEIKNDTKIESDSNIYVIAIAKTDEKHPRQCLIDFKTGDCDVVTSNKDVARLSQTKLSDIEKDSNGNSLFHVAHVQSGRIYFSINQPLSLYFDSITHTIPDPDGFKTRDPNYYTLYDKVEFSFVSAGVWFNPTAVDFFSLPIELSDKDSVTVKSAGLVDSRASIFAKIHEVFANNDKTPNHEWSNLFLKYNNHDIRVMSPGKAMIEINGQEQNPYKNTSFSPQYLSDLQKFGFDYLDAVWTYYKNNDIKIYVKELEGQKDDNGKTLPVACDDGAFSLTDYTFTGKIDPITNNFVFKNTDGCEVKIAKPKSISFFAGAVGSFDAPNNTPKAIIVRELTSAFDVGLLPAPTGTTFSLPKEVIQDGKYIPNPDNYLIKNLHAGHYYQSNPLLNSGNTGPWYDLYSKALHEYGHEHPIYTFAYDDALGQDGTIHEGNGENPGKVTITLHDLTGTDIPNPLVEKTGFDVYVTVPEALYLFRTVNSTPTSIVEFAGTDMLLNTTNSTLYFVKNSAISAISLPDNSAQELKTIVAMPRNTDDNITLFNGAMKEFLIKNEKTITDNGLPLESIKVTLKNGPSGVEELHDATTGANHLTNITSPMKFTITKEILINGQKSSISSKDAEVYLDPYIVLPNDPEFDGVLLGRNPGAQSNEVMITIPGNKPRN